MYKLRMIAVSICAFSASAISATFLYNQVGYDAGKPVSVIVKSAENLEGTSYSLLKEDSPVYTGTFPAGENPDNWLSSGNFFVVDLGSSLETGNYALQLSDGTLSGTFSVAENVLASKTLSSVLNYFYADRADDNSILSQDAAVSVYGSSVVRNVQGGWYDASGDVSKYLSHLSYANYLNPQQIPMTVWTLAFAASHIPSLLSGVSAQTNPSAEAVYGADFLLRMLDPEGFFYMTVFDNWGSGSRYLCAFSGSDGEKSPDYRAAFREGGGMAIAALAKASTLGVSGDSSSAQYLAAAKRAFEHLQGMQTVNGACAYCDDGRENIIDYYTALLAATELYAASGEASYLDAARERAENLSSRLGAEGFFWSDSAKSRPFWHASDAGLPLIALVRFLEVEKSETVLQAASAHLNWLLKVTSEVSNPFGYARQAYKTQGTFKTGFFIPHDNESGYWWQGESARIASLSAAAVYAGKSIGMESASLQKYAADQLDWILGKNPYGICIMYGKGLLNPPIYSGQSPYAKTLEGGIANGITGVNADGSGIVWNDYAAAGFSQSWQVWRWTEQWLPHTTWFLMALAARYDEVTTGLGFSAIARNQEHSGFSVRVENRQLVVTLRGRRSGSLSVSNLQGRTLHRQDLTSANTTVDLGRLPQGVYLVRVSGESALKIQIRN